MVSHREYEPAKVSHGRSSALAWCLLIIMVIVLGGFKAWQNWRDADAQQRWHARWKVLPGDRQEQFDQLRDHLQSLLGKPGSQRQLQGDWNGSQPFALRRENGRSVCDWEDPKYGCHFLLKFEDGELRGWNADLGAGLERLYPPPPRFCAMGGRRLFGE